MSQPSPNRGSRRLGVYLKACRQERRLSLRQVERLSAGECEPIANSYLASCETGRFIPSIQKLLSLSRVLGIPIQNCIERIELEQYGSLKPELDSFEACRKLGIEEAQKGNLARSYACFERAVELGHLGDSDPLRLATAELDIAIVLKRMGKHGTARDTLERALRLPGLPLKLRVRALDLLAGVQRELGNLTLALLCSQEAGRLACLHKEHRLAPHIWNTQGNIHYDLQEFAPAAPCYEKAVRGFRRGGEKVGLIVAISNFGNCLLRLGRVNDGLERLNEALLLARHEDCKRLQADILGYLARAHFERDEHVEARRMANESNQIARRGDYFDILFTNHFYLWKIARAHKNRSEAGIYLKSLRYFRTKIESTMPELVEFDRYVRGSVKENADREEGYRRLGCGRRRVKSSMESDPSTWPPECA